MTRRHPIRVVIALAGAFGLRPAGAQDAVLPAAPPAAGAALERAARENAVKMDAMQKVRDARVRRVSRTICSGCTGPANRPGRARPASGDEPRPRDPAQAPED